MSCEEIENKILDYQENQLSAAQRQEVENHLAGCAGCRGFAGQLQQLDAALSAGVNVPALSDSFERSLRKRIQTAPVVLSEAQRVERQRQLQAEFEAGMARIFRMSFTLGSLLNQLTRTALAAVVAWLAWHLTAQMTGHIHVKIAGDLAPNLIPWLAASAVFVAVGLVQAFSREWRFFKFW